MATAEDDDREQEARLARVRALVAGCREAARRALGFARAYRAEEGGAGGERERACLDAVRAWRTAARELRAGSGAAAAPLARPGVARARAAARAARARTAS